MRQSKRSLRVDRPSDPTPPVSASRRGLLDRALRGVVGHLLGTADAPATASRGTFERLEERRLLTSLFGGETFRFLSYDWGDVSDDGEIDVIPVVIEVQGSPQTRVELYGAGVDAGGFNIGDLSGTITDSPNPERLGPTRGGIGGTVGAAPIVPDNLDFESETGGRQLFNRTDYIGSPFGQVFLATQGLIQFSSLATNELGQTYGLQIVELDVGGDTVRQLQIAQLNTDTDDLVEDGSDDARNPGTGSLANQTNVGDALYLDNLLPDFLSAVAAVDNGDFEQDALVEVIGADFVPGDQNTLYVAASITVNRATSNTNGQAAEVDVPFIFTVDLNSLGAGPANVDVIARDFVGDVTSGGGLQSLDAQTVASDVTAFAMYDANTVALFGSFSERFNENSGQQNVQTRRGLLVTDISPQALTQTVDIDEVIPLGEIDRLEALEYRPIDSFPQTPAGDPTLSTLYGLTEAGEEAQLIRFGENELGGNFTVIGGISTSANEDDPRGDNALSLTWDPTLENLFLNPNGGEFGGFLTFDVDTDQLLRIDQRPRGVASALALYNITVINGDENTRITAYALDDDGNPIGFSGTSNPLAGVGDGIIEGPGGTGPLYLGLKFVFDDPEFVDIVHSIPVGTVTEGSSEYFGPTYNGQIRPGLYTVDGSLGAFYWGGVVTGNVRIEGSLGEFYAGLIATGDASGGLDFDAAYEQDNFAVFGDVGTVISATSIGTDQSGATAPDFSEFFGPDGDYTGFSTGTEFAIGGIISSIRSGSAIAAAFDIRGDRPVNFDPTTTFYKQRQAVVDEIEFQTDDDNAGSAFAQGTPRITALYNDSFDSYEPIGAYGGNVTINGLISSDLQDDSINDSVDYYGLPLMAGQEIILQLQTLGGGPTNALHIGVFDPDGRLVATDYEDNPNSMLQTRNRPFRLRAETAGVYRIAVATRGDADFDEAGGEFGQPLYTLESYQVVIQDAGNLTVGGIKAQNFIYAQAAAPVLETGDLVRVHKGDLGVIESQTGTILGAAPIRTLAGHIRQISGSSVGYYDPDPLESIGWVNARAAHSLGAIRASGIGGGNYGGDIFFNWTGVTDADNVPLVSEAQGDDIQIVKAARDVLGNFIAGRGIGSIVAGRDWAAPIGSPGGAFSSGLIYANVDDINDDGFVDMLSVGGNLGVGSENGRIRGGPGIDVGTNGNFRYLDVPEGAQFARDPFFGNRTGEPYQTLVRGESFTFTDDSGTQVTVFPSDEELEFNNGTSTVSRPAGQISVLTYPVRSGGSILASVRTDQSLRITTQDRGPRATAEIGNIRMTGDGRPVVNATDPNFPDASRPTLRLAGTAFSEPDSFNDLEIDFGGNNLDVFSIDAIGTGEQAGKFTAIRNNTGGEIVDVTAASIGTLEADRIGVSQTRGFARLDAAQTRVDQYPFNNQPYLIGVEGDVVEIRGETIGNVFVGLAQGFDNIGGDGTGGGGGGGTGGGDGGIDGGGGNTGGGVDNTGGGVDNTGGGINNTGGVIGGPGDGIGGTSGDGEGTGGVGGIGLQVLGENRGRIGRIVANRNGAFDNDFMLEGIVGPVVAATPDTEAVQGQIGFIDIGEGIADDGRGNLSTGGVYAEGFIAELVGNNGANIYGDVVALELGTLTLNGGALINADILQAPSRIGAGAGNFDATREFDFVRGALPAFTEVSENADATAYEFDRIILNGGGIIGTQIGAADVDVIQVNNGFGIFTSYFSTVVEGVFNLVSTDGLGIRNTFIGGGRDVNTVIAKGDASLIDITQFGRNVDRSRFGEQFHNETGEEYNASNDLRRALGLPSDVSRRRRITNSGVIENARIVGSRDLGSLTASVIRSNLLTVDPLVGFEESAEGIGQGNPQGEFLLSSVDFGRNVNLIDAISTYGFRVTAGGLTNYRTSKDILNTNIRISGQINNVDAGGQIRGDSSVRADGPDGRLLNLEATDLYGFVSADVGIGTITVHNNLAAPTDEPAVPLEVPATIRSLGGIDRLEVGNNILTGAYVRATEEIGSLLVGGDLQAGAIVQADAIGNQEIDGNIFGDIIIV